jgi:hypothetical protein
VALLADRAKGCGRFVPMREVTSAVARAKKVQWVPGRGQGAGDKKQESGGRTQESVAGSCHLSPVPYSRRWSDLDRQVRKSVAWWYGGLAELWHQSPLQPDDMAAEEVLAILFPGDPLLCCGRTASDFDVRPRSEWGRDVRDLALIVPSPMKAVFGTTQEGKRSKHSLSNTGPRSYLVCEFDAGTANEHAAILLHLSELVPLACAVYSGGKSLHGWFTVRDEPEADVLKFFQYAVSLGADPATWTRSQFVRMPDGTRQSGEKQPVFLLNPDAVRLAG